MVPSLHTDLVRGVATYWMEFFTAQPQLDVVYIPIGQGSGICGAVAARNALGLTTKIIGVVSSHALAYKLSFEQGRNIASPVTTVLADGMACRVPDDASLAVIFEHVSGIVAVSDEEIAVFGDAQCGRRCRCCRIGGGAAKQDSIGRFKSGAGAQWRQCGSRQLCTGVKRKCGNKKISTIETL
jgi:threonine dehydratase